MSRARKVAGRWWDMNENGSRATLSMIELLASVEDSEFEELLEANLTQGDVVLRLRVALGEGDVPESVSERREARKEWRKTQRECRKCGKHGDSTRHHFFNKWMMKEISDYPQFSRDRCTIPLCRTCHSQLHSRKRGNKSVVTLLTPEERDVAERLSSKLYYERPRLWRTVAGGEDNVYESRFLRDWLMGRFDH